MRQLNLNGLWQFWQSGTEEKMPVSVPGSVLSGLLDNKKIPDPYYRDNEYATRELFWNDYEFERTFSVGEELLACDQVELVCEGLDTLADVFVNGTLTASTDNMHRTYRIPVKAALKVGENHIRVLFKSVFKYIEAYEYAENKEIHYTPTGGILGNQLIRKAHSMFGWDWGPQLIDAGFYRDIYLEGNDGARLKDVYIRQKHEDGKVELSIRSVLEKISGKVNDDWTVEVTVSRENGEVFDRQAVALKELAGDIWRNPDEDITVMESLTVENPKLWWPNGYGKQPLYEVCVTVKDQDGNVTAEEKKLIGLRTVTVSQDKDQWGSEFAFMINGLKIYARGADYIPEDCVYSWITRDRSEVLLKDCIRANYNCIRIWGGGYYPSDDFYDLCDHLGLIVWQDLMYACNAYDLTESFEKTIVQEAIDNVRRLRHHASLGLWCGNNEIESAWDHWDNFKGETQANRMDYVKMFEYILPKTVKAEDPDTFYWASSPSSGGGFDDPDDENRGDAHYWAVWHGQKPFTDYQRYFFRFCSEYGFQSFPCKKTVDSFTEEEDRNIFSKVMESHQKNGSANGKILYYLSENFRYPKDFDNLLYISQVLQAAAIKFGSEHWRRNRGRCMGTLYWQVNDNWPVASWSSIDYYGRWKALHYMAKKFYAPVAMSLCKTDDTMSVHVSNETAAAQKCTAFLRVRDVNLNVVRELKAEGVAEPYSVAELVGATWAELLEGFVKEEVFAEAEVIFEDGTVQTESNSFAPYKHMNLVKQAPSVEVEEQEDKFVITLQSDVFAPYVELDFADADVLFSDNYFDLSNEKPVKITVLKEDIRKGRFADAEDMQNRLKVRTLADSYV